MLRKWSDNLKLYEDWVTQIASATPAYVYDCNMFKARIKTTIKALAGAEFYYSMKANPFRGFIKTAVDCGIGVEVASTGEFDYAITCGAQSKSICVAGPGKINDINYYIKRNIGRIHCESIREFDVASKQCKEIITDTQLALRLNPSTSIDSAERMTGGSSRFGIDEETIIQLINDGLLQPSGFHLYQGSQIYDWHVTAEAIQYLRNVASHSKKMGCAISYLNYGGGFGVSSSMALDSKNFDLASLSKWWSNNLLSSEIIATEVFELGRYFAAPCGVLICKVLEVKKSRNQIFVILDGGMNVFSRPTLVGDFHDIIILDPDSEDDGIVCGPTCTPLDVIGHTDKIPREDSYVVITNAGAYGYSMGIKHFLGHPTASEWYVSKDRDRLRLYRRNIMATEYYLSGCVSEW